MTTLIDVFRSLEGRRGEFVIHDDGYRVRRFTYEQVTRAARGFARRLERAGVTAGDKLLLWGENSAEWLACYWGAVIAGVIVVPIDYRSSPAFASRVAAIVDAKLVCIGSDVDGAAHGSSFGSPVTVWRFDELDWAADGPMPDRSITRDDIAQIVFTSGATSDPKGVVVRHKNLLANLVPVAKEVAKYKPYARPFLPLRFLNLLPLSHLFGQSMATNIPPLVDGTVVFMRSFNPHDLVRRVREWRISVIVCVPKILDVLREHAIRLDPAAADPPKGLSIPARWWRYRTIHRAFGFKYWAFVVGAAPLAPELEEFWKRLGFVVIQGYGLTETAPIVTLNHPFKTNTGSVGTPVGGVDVKIAEDGEILVRGDNVTDGYYEPGRESGAGSRESGVGRDGPGAGTSRLPRRRTQRRRRRLRDDQGWLHTGDIGELDAQGRLFIRGRKKEMIVTPEGLNVFPDDVERVVDQVEGVVESAVVGHRDPGTASERVHAVLVLEPGGRWTPWWQPPTRRWPIISGFAAPRCGRADRCPAPRARGSSSAPRCEPGSMPARLRLPPRRRMTASRRCSDASRAGARPGRHDYRSARLELARTRRADGGARGQVPDAPRRVEVRQRADARRPEIAARARPRGSRRRRAGRLPALEPGAVRGLGPAREPGDLDPPRRPAVRVGPRERPRTPSRFRGARGFRGQPPEPPGCPGDPLALPGRWRARVAPAMAKEFFKAHFFPEQHPAGRVLSNRLNYYLAALFFNAFPLPQREAGARQTLRYIGEVTGDGFSVLIFPEGVRSATGDIKAFGEVSG